MEENNVGKCWGSQVFTVWPPLGGHTLDPSAALHIFYPYPPKKGYLWNFQIWKTTKFQSVVVVLVLVLVLGFSDDFCSPKNKDKQSIEC